MARERAEPLWLCRFAVCLSVVRVRVANLTVNVNLCVSTAAPPDFRNVATDSIPREPRAHIMEASLLAAARTAACAAALTKACANSSTCRQQKAQGQARRF